MLKNKLLAAMGGSAPSDPYFSNVSMLLPGDGANGSQSIIDSSASPKSISVFANAKISSAMSKFGGGSIYFDGTGDYLSFSNAGFNFGVASFTVDLWFYYVEGLNKPYTAFFDNGGQGTYLSFGASERNLLFYSSPSNLDNAGLPHMMISNAWNHLAFVRNSSVLTAYVNGASVYSKTGITGSMSPTGATAYIGTYSGSPGSNTYDINGYIDEFRVTNGVARYTANFAPPTRAFPNK